MTTRSIALVKDNAGTGLTELQVNSAGALKVDLEIDESTLATAANQTNGSQKSQILGNSAGDGSGTQTHLVTDVQGHLQVDVLNQNQEAQLAAFTDITNVSSVKRLLCDSDGHLQVDIVSGGGGGGGDATAANQVTGNASLATIAGDTTSLDGKVTACDTGAVVISSGSVGVTGTVTVDGSGVTQPVSGSVAVTNTSIATTSSLTVTSDTLTISSGGSSGTTTVIAAGGFGQAEQDFGATITGGQRKAEQIFIKFTNSFPTSISISLDISVDGSTFVPLLVGSPKTTSIATDVFPLSDITGTNFVCPRYLRFAINNSDFANPTTVTMSLHYYE